MSHNSTAPTEAKRVKSFAVFFKNYMSVSSLVTASLPIPITAAGLIPAFKAHKWVLSTYTPLFCFLILGFIFFSRHTLARLMFPQYFAEKAGGPGAARLASLLSPRRVVAVLPLALICCSAACVFRYHSLLNANLTKILEAAPDAIRQPFAVNSGLAGQTNISTGIYYLVDMAQTTATNTDGSVIPVGARMRLGDTTFVLEHTPSIAIPDSAMLMIYYIGIFLAAEAAFILMAIKEYLQDLLGFEDAELIRGPRQRAVGASGHSAPSANTNMQEAGP